MGLPGDRGKPGHIPGMSRIGQSGQSLPSQHHRPAHTILPPRSHFQGQGPELRLGVDLNKDHPKGARQRCLSEQLWQGRQSPRLCFGREPVAGGGVGENGRRRVCRPAGGGLVNRKQDILRLVRGAYSAFSGRSYVGSRKQELGKSSQITSWSSCAGYHGAYRWPPRGLSSAFRDW